MCCSCVVHVFFSTVARQFFSLDFGLFFCRTCINFWMFVFNIGDLWFLIVASLNAIKAHCQNLLPECVVFFCTCFTAHFHLKQHAFCKWFQSMAGTHATRQNSGVPNFCVRCSSRSDQTVKQSWIGNEVTSNAALYLLQFHIKGGVRWVRFLLWLENRAGGDLPW